MVNAEIEPRPNYDFTQLLRVIFLKVQTDVSEETLRGSTLVTNQYTIFRNGLIPLFDHL